MSDAQTNGRASAADALLTAGTKAFGDFLDRTAARINRPLKEYEARQARLRLIGEITEVAALQDIALTPTQILTLAMAIGAEENGERAIAAHFVLIASRQPAGDEQIADSTDSTDSTEGEGER